MRKALEALGVAFLAASLTGSLAACQKVQSSQNAPVASPRPCVKAITPAASAGPKEVQPVENGPVPPLTAGGKFGEEPNTGPGVGPASKDFIRSILVHGTGTEVSASADVIVNYKGQTWDGNVFDNTWSTGKTASFSLTRTIDGWTWGLAGAHVGDRVELVIPPKLGYGELDEAEKAQKAAGKIPENRHKLAGETLVYVIDIVFSPPVEQETQLAAYTQLLSKSRPIQAKLPTGLKIYCNPGEEPQPAFIEGTKVPSAQSKAWTMEGQGRPIRVGDQIGYMVVSGAWGDAPKSNWTNGQGVYWGDAQDFQVIGKTVGSRLVTITPPNKNAKRGLVEIIDIVDAINVSESGSEAATVATPPSNPAKP